MILLLPHSHPNSVAMAPVFRVKHVLAPLLTIQHPGFLYVKTEREQRFRGNAPAPSFKTCTPCLHLG
jgi:hypothetical protein